MITIVLILVATWVALLALVAAMLHVATSTPTPRRTSPPQLIAINNDIVDPRDASPPHRRLRSRSRTPTKAA